MVHKSGFSLYNRERAPCLFVVKHRLSQGFLLGSFFSRTPALFPPSAGMNSTPAFSSACWIFQMVSTDPLIAESEASRRLTVATPTDAAFANSS